MIGSIYFGTMYSKVAVLDRLGMPEVLECHNAASKAVNSAVYFENEKNVVLYATLMETPFIEGAKV